MLSDPNERRTRRRSDEAEAIAAALEAMALPALRGTPLDPDAVAPPAAADFVASFRDDAGHHRRVDRPFLGFMLGIRLSDVGEAGVDVQLWRDLAAGRQTVAAADRARTLIADGSGPLMPVDARGTIETWTEAELCALHALSRVAKSDRSLRPRVDAAADWLVAELQPDNATHHPWACHVFFERWLREDSFEHKLYGETLVQNATVARSMPDRFSACILLDAAACLRSPAEA